MFELLAHAVLMAQLVSVTLQCNCGDYRGWENHTTSDRACQKWTQQAPHEHDYTPGRFPSSGLGDHNYCRNVEGSSFTAWCYTTDPQTRWEYCPVGEFSPTCNADHHTGPEECYSSPSASDYRGVISVTRSGLPCQRWTSQVPHEHSDWTPGNHPGKGLGDHNYCRNPDPDSDMAWCYTIDANVRWEYCNVGIPQEQCDQETSTTPPSSTAPPYPPESACAMTRTCSGGSIHLQCPPEKPAIFICDAMYGRQLPGPKACPDPRIRTTDCVAPRSLSIVKDTCQAEPSCTISANHHLFTDPCTGTYKYLEIDYRCAFLSRVCEGGTLRLSCGAGKTIAILDAFYGRMAGGDVCPHPSISNQNCRAENSLDVLGARCQGHNSCSVRASNDVFGDPCVGTYKYLEVIHDCV